MHYQRTELGNLELQVRHFPLPARARTLLLLLQSDDLWHLSAAARERILTAQNLELLLQFQLIEIIPEAPPITSPLNSASAVKVEQVLHGLQRKMDDGSDTRHSLKHAVTTI